MKPEIEKQERKTNGESPLYTYPRPDSYYINVPGGTNSPFRNEKEVNKLEFYFTMILWFITGKKFKKRNKILILP